MCPLKIPSFTCLCRAKTDKQKQKSTLYEISPLNSYYRIQITDHGMVVEQLRKTVAKLY